MGLLVAAALVALQGVEPTTWIAVTRDGVRIEALEPAVGDLSVRTPFGVLSTPLDPIVEVVEAHAQTAQLEALFDAGLVDQETFLRDLSTAGQLTALAERLDDLLASDPYSTLPFELMETWAERIDPVPPSTPLKARVAWLWERACGKEFIPGVIAAWRLPKEITGGTTVQSRHRTISESDLASEGFESPYPWTRRAAAFAAGKQHSPLLREHLLQYSISDSSPAVRDACAGESQRTMSHAARQFWVLNLLRGSGGQRDAAAENLGLYGGKEGRRALLYALSAWDLDAPEQYSYDGRKMWLRKETLRGIELIRDKRHHYYGGAATASGTWDGNYLYSPDVEHERIDLGSRLKITDYDAGFTAVLLDALDLSMGRKTGFGVVEWLQTQDEDYAPVQP